MTRVAGPPFSENHLGESIAAGDGAAVELAAEPPHDDRLATTMLCGKCGPGKVSGSHGHRFIEEPEDRLRVTISRPRAL